MLQNPTLYQSLLEMKLEDLGGELSFAQRLARENHWPPSFACRVIGEYRRFLYLTKTAGAPVTPSEEVDQAWHLHLIYTRSYWNNLCSGILGQALHHGPTAGGKAERAKYLQQYEGTLRRYAEEFGQAPPTDIWPPPAERFHPRNRFRWVNEKQFWILPKWRQTGRHFRLVPRPVAVSYACLASVALDPPERGSGLPWTIILSLAFAAVVLLVGNMLGGFSQSDLKAKRKASRDSSGSTFGCGSSSNFDQTGTDANGDGGDGGGSGCSSGCGGCGGD